MASTATVIITGTIGTEPEGSLAIGGTFTNSTSVGTLIQTTFGAALANASTFVVPANARWAYISPGQISSTLYTYYANSTVGATTAICPSLVSSGGALFPVATTATMGSTSGRGSTLVFFTSAAAWNTTPLRILFF